MFCAASLQTTNLEKLLTINEANIFQKCITLLFDSSSMNESELHGTTPNISLCKKCWRKINDYNNIRNTITNLEAKLDDSKKLLLATAAPSVYKTNNAHCLDIGNIWLLI